MVSSKWIFYATKLGTAGRVSMRPAIFHPAPRGAGASEARRAAPAEAPVTLQRELGPSSSVALGRLATGLELVSTTCTWGWLPIGWLDYCWILLVGYIWLVPRVCFKMIYVTFFDVGGEELALEATFGHAVIVHWFTVT